MSPGTYIYPTEIKNGWAKHTHSNKWNTFTGWSSMKYLQKVSNTRKSGVATASIETKASEYAENQLGVLGIYGFDASGARLFKTEIADNSEWFEQVEPKIYISTTKVLEETAINKTVRKDGSGNNQASGAVGKWNDCTGKLVVRREKNTKGEYLWNFKLCKYVNGKLTETLQTTNSLVSSKYPKTDLNYLGFYIGGYGDKDVVSVIAVTNVKVIKLNLLADATINNNLTLFEPGDHLQIDFEGGEVTLNGVSIASEIDIASLFFNVPVGQSELIVLSDDDTMTACCGVREKFI